MEENQYKKSMECLPEEYKDELTYFFIENLRKDFSECFKKAYLSFGKAQAFISAAKRVDMDLEQLGKECLDYTVVSLMQKYSKELLEQEKQNYLNYIKC